MVAVVAVVPVASAGLPATWVAAVLAVLAAMGQPVVTAAPGQ
ncbi:hypothetical protein [Mycobacterium riyadhense]